MSTSSLYSELQPSYTIDLNEEHQEEIYDHQLLLDHHNTTPVSFSSLQSLSQDQIGYLYMGSQLHPSPYHQEVGSYDGNQGALEINKAANHTKLKFTLCKKEDQISVGKTSVNWTPFRLMKNVVRGDEDQKMEAETRHFIRNSNIGGSPSISSSSNNNSNKNDNTAIRVCSDCNTTKTPLWRSGPRGPKSLCNACGIRQRKARRAMAAVANGSMIPNSMSGSTMRPGNGHKKAPKNINNNGIGAQKKRSKIVKPSREHHHIGAQRKLCFEKFALNLSKKLSLQQVFPQEEKDAAILLMAISCGLVHE